MRKSKPLEWLQTVFFVSAAGTACAATVQPSVAVAPSTLFGILDELSSNVFGTIDPTTGAFTQLGSARFPAGYHAPVRSSGDPTESPGPPPLCALLEGVISV